MDYLKISFRSLLYRWRQYFSLFLVCAFGVGISLFCLFLVDGMLDALENKARIYYGGDYQFLGGDADLEIYGVDKYIDGLKEVFPSDAIISARIDYDAREDSAFFYEGMCVRQRVVKGIDFNTEKNLFKMFNYLDGNADDIAGTNGVLLSQPIAKMLECKVGDSITFMLSTNDGFKNNTVDLVVKGIFIDSSLFGMYTSYIDIDYLRKAAHYESDFATRIGIFFPNRNVKEKDVYRYNEQLKTKYNMYKITHDKYEFYDDLYEYRLPNPSFALLPLDSNMNELNIIIEAMNLITLLVIVALVVIIVVGISSTYRVIIMKRINEIGIYKAIGMNRFTIYRFLLSETFGLLFAGCLAGLVVFFGLSALIQCFNFSFIPAFDVFLTNGYVVPLFNFAGVLLIFAVVLVTTLAAVLFSIKEAVRKMPCEALAATE